MGGWPNLTPVLSAKNWTELPPLPDSILYAKVQVGASQEMIWAKRPGLEARIPLGIARETSTAQGVFVKMAQLPLRALPVMITVARAEDPLEVLQYVYRGESGQWVIERPKQHQEPDRCLDTGDPTLRSIALVDAHSHPSFPARPSRMDDASDSGFKVYVIFGRLKQWRPEVTCRVGVFGNLMPIPVSWVFGPLAHVFVQEGRR